jgi:hypothetical protein
MGSDSFRRSSFTRPGECRSEARRWPEALVALLFDLGAVFGIGAVVGVRAGVLD